VFINFVQALIRKEMITLKSLHVARNAQLSKDNWVPKLSEIEEELISHTPLLHRMLRGMLCRSEDFTERLRVTVGLSWNSYSQRLNLFQKMIGLIPFI